MKKIFIFPLILILLFTSCSVYNLNNELESLISEDPSAVGEDNISQEPSSPAQEPSSPAQEPSSVINPSDYPKVTVIGEFSQPVSVTPEEAVELVKGKMTVSNIEDYSFDVECHTSESGDYYFIRVFSTEWFDDVQIMMGYTIGWYKVDATTGEVTEEI